MSLAEAIREARLKRGLTQQKLARLLDTTESNIRNWERGRNLPSFPLYAGMCVVFDWPLPYSGGPRNPGLLNRPNDVTRPLGLASSDLRMVA